MLSVHLSLAAAAVVALVLGPRSKISAAVVAAAAALDIALGARATAALAVVAPLRRVPDRGADALSADRELRAGRPRRRRARQARTRQRPRALRARVRPLRTADRDRLARRRRRADRAAHHRAAPPLRRTARAAAARHGRGRERRLDRRSPRQPDQPRRDQSSPSVARGLHRAHARTRPRRRDDLRPRRRAHPPPHARRHLPATASAAVAANPPGAPRRARARRGRAHRMDRATDRDRAVVAIHGGRDRRAAADAQHRPAADPLANHRASRRARHPRPSARPAPAEPDSTHPPHTARPSRSGPAPSPR